VTQIYKEVKYENESCFNLTKIDSDIILKSEL